MSESTERSMESELHEIKVILESIADQRALAAKKVVRGPKGTPPMVAAEASVNDSWSKTPAALKDNRSPGIPTKKERKATRREREAATYRRRRKNKNNNDNDEKENVVTSARRSPRTQSPNKILIASLREVVNRMLDMI